MSRVQLEKKFTLSLEEVKQQRKLAIGLYNETRKAQAFGTICFWGMVVVAGFELALRSWFFAACTISLVFTWLVSTWVYSADRRLLMSSRDFCLEASEEGIRLTSAVFDKRLYWNAFSKRVEIGGHIFLVGELLACVPQRIFNENELNSFRAFCDAHLSEGNSVLTK